MASILAKILDGEITSEDLADPCHINRNENDDVKDAKENFKQHNITELVPFLLNYLREKSSHHLTPRQSAALTPKKTSVSQAKGANSTTEPTQYGTKSSSRGNLFPSQKTPSPSPVTPLSQSRRDKLHEHHSSPSSSPHFRRKSPRVQGNDRDRLSPLVTQPKLNIDDPDDFPPMGSNSKKVTPSRRITPTQVKSDGKKGKSSPAFTSSPFSSSHPVLESHGSPASLQEERNMLKLMKSKRKTRGIPLGEIELVPAPNLASDLPNFTSWEISSCFGADAVSSQQFEEQACKERTQFLQVVKDKVVFHDKLDALAKIYSRCILENLVPNVTAELYFVVQLLTARGIAPEPKQDEEIGKADNQNVLDSIHNCAYFAVAVSTRDSKIADFSPSLKETFLQQYKNILTY
ncbi:negative regulation of DNA replication [Desmophyllum pertusum]|uniref:Negative regulation of DNA replication n=1 Tax=Desmophyllum pertusum TaxID=174260 RepID=A0A9X0CJP0_9CNID|nr:negative regulation of DNA replication [Desmophyllum pertusum]